MQFVGRRRSSTGFGVVSVAAAGILSLVVAACAPVPPQPPSTGVDLTVTVTGAKAVIGASASYGATVANVGTQTATDLVSATVVAPPSQPITGVDAAGWSCATAAAGVSVTCTQASSLSPGATFAPITVTTSVSGPVGASVVYAAVNTPDDANRSNDVGRGNSRVVPPFGSDQLYIQLAGALNLRSGGDVGSGGVTITNDWQGPRSLEIDATVGTTQVTASLQRLAASLFTGPVTITDPNLQGGVPLSVDWRGVLAGFGTQPFSNLSGNQVDLRIPSLDISGISTAALSGITFSLGITAGDYQPNPPNPDGQPALVYSAPEPVWQPRIVVPSRVVNGATFGLGVELIAATGASSGPVSANVDLPVGLEFVSAGAGTTCTPVPAVAGRQRCVLNASSVTPVASNVVGRVLAEFLPTGFPVISLNVRPTVEFTDLNVRATVDSALAGTGAAQATFSPFPPGPDVGLTMVGPDSTPALWFTEGVGLSQNQYQFTVDNVGTATSASNGLNVQLVLPAGITYRGFTTSGFTTGTRFTCSNAGNLVTCTRPSGIPVTSLLSPAPTFAVLVDVAAPPPTSVMATASVTNTNDVDPANPAKSASSTTLVAAAGAPTFGVSLTNGAFAATGRPVLKGGFAYTVAPNGRLDGISGCARSRDYTPPVLLVPIVGPTLVPAQYSGNQLCIFTNRVPLTNQWVGSTSVDFVSGPVYVPGIPTQIPLIQPRPVSAPAATVSAPTLQPDGSLAGSATGVNPELALNGGSTYGIDWNLGVVPGVTCIDVGSCP
jgi:hypothetical protein